MKRIGLIVTIIYVAVSYSAEFIGANAGPLDAVGVGEAARTLSAGALEQVGRAIATVALTVGLALPSMRDQAIVPKAPTP